MLGYSDILLATPLSPEQRELAGRIGQQVRRTKSLVASLLSFAKQSPAAMAPVDLNTLLRTAIKLTQAQWQTNKIELHTDLDMEMPPVMGDSNQLLQVLVQTLGNALYAADEARNRTLTIATKLQNGIASIDISDCSAEKAVSSKEKTLGNAPPDPDSLRPLSGLGLSACQGILKQHRGRIFWENEQNTSVAIRIEIPVTAPAVQETSGSPAAAGVPGM
jgi:two-component system NtrC family sensor kinase